MEPATIFFYSTCPEHADFSNLSAHGFELDGRFWPSVEHYFQAQKFPDPAEAERVRRAASPAAARRLGRRRSVPVRPDWEEVREAVMRRALRAKFAAHPELRARLLATGQAALVENSPRDRYWGAGRDGGGRNRTGHLLMEVRAELAAAAPAAAPAPPRRVLFVCTGNYYRSRFAEAVFNHEAERRGLPWRAFSRGLAVHLAVGPLSPHTRQALAQRGIPLRHTGADRAALTPADLRAADLVVALQQTEHRPLFTTQFPDWERPVTYWEIPDIPHATPAAALPRIERHVRRLVAELTAGPGLARTGDDPSGE